MQRKDVGKQKTRCIVTGSFDPITLGHVDVVNRAKNDFDLVYVVAFINDKKPFLFTLDERKEILDELFKDDERVITDAYSGLTVNYCKANGINIIIRGFRDKDDYEYEAQMADWNRKRGGLETLLIPAVDARMSISSSSAREALKKGKKLDGLIPDKVIKTIKKIYKNKKEK